MTRAAVILSSRYVSATMQSEFGSVPPAFLPLAGTVLLEHQVALLKKSGGADETYLTLPDSYVLPVWQERLSGSLGVRILRVPVEFSIGEALLFALVVSGRVEGGIRVLYGDTMIDGLDMARDDVVTVDHPPDAGHWAVLTEPADPGERPRLVSQFVEDGDSQVMSGYCSFSSIAMLSRAIALSHYDFVAALSEYDGHIPLIFERAGRWYDFGRPRTFFESRRDFTTERHFNSLEIRNHTVIKRSAQTEKMEAEALWFHKLPPALRKFTPAFLGQIPAADGGPAGYSLEYLNMLPLSDCFAHLNLPVSAWDDAISSCLDFVEECRAHPGDCNLDTGALYGRKTMDRLAQFCQQRGLDKERVWTVNGTDAGSLSALAARAAALIPPIKQTHIMHGDLCFSNILLDTRTGRIRLIDPRGALEPGRPTIYGDSRYDLAKLHHSYSGHYDLILAGRGALTEHAPYNVDFCIEVTDAQNAVSARFADALARTGLAEPRVLHAICVLLFLSMTPLHIDRPNRQMQLAVNALRLGLDL